MNRKTLALLLCGTLMDCGGSSGSAGGMDGGAIVDADLVGPADGAVCAPLGMTGVLWQVSGTGSQQVAQPTTELAAYITQQLGAYSSFCPNGFDDPSDYSQCIAFWRQVGDDAQACSSGVMHGAQGGCCTVGRIASLQHELCYGQWFDLVTGDSDSGVGSPGNVRGGPCLPPEGASAVP